MKRLYSILTALLISAMPMFAQNQFSISEYANFVRYEKANALFDKPTKNENRVVFMGNSITEAWPDYSKEFFSDNGYIGRGIGGQVTHQMLLRFQADVINLEPKVVVILAGTNDIAQNSGRVSLTEIMQNIKSMAELAMQNGIKVILCSVLPAKDYPWKKGMDPLKKIPGLNQMIKSYAVSKNITYADYYEAMQDGNGGLKVPEYTSANDLVHPNKAGYAVMEKVIKPIIDKILEK